MTTVTAALGFFAGSDGPPVYVASEGGSDARLNVSGRFDEHEIEIRDGREANERFDLDEHGFVLVDDLEAVPGFLSASDIGADYEGQVRSLVAGYTGARRVEVFDHTLRADDPAVRGERLSREPTALLHNDYTERSAPQRVRDLFPGEADALLQRRFAIVNVWRPLAHAVETKPLAVCDARSLDAADLVPCERRARERTGELMLVKYNPAQRWFWFPLMQIDEALLIKTFDSARDGRGRFSPHTAFDPPGVPEDARARQSIESRTFVFF